MQKYSLNWRFSFPVDITEIKVFFIFALCSRSALLIQTVDSNRATWSHEIFILLDFPFNHNLHYHSSFHVTKLYVKPTGKPIQDSSEEFEPWSCEQKAFSWNILKPIFSKKIKNRHKMRIPTAVTHTIPISCQVTDLPGYSWIHCILCVIQIATEKNLWCHMNRHQVLITDVLDSFQVSHLDRIHKEQLHFLLWTSWK